jgi:hypothetical protein
MNPWKDAFEELQDLVQGVWTHVDILTNSADSLHLYEAIANLKTIRKLFDIDDDLDTLSIELTMEDLAEEAEYEEWKVKILGS